VTIIPYRRLSQEEYEFEIQTRIVNIPARYAETVKNVINTKLISEIDEMDGVLSIEFTEMPEITREEV
jgi:hypothetical protein